ncbi:MAG: hypothetical protein AAGA48_08825 [Myxococcota bacterium]
MATAAALPEAQRRLFADGFVRSGFISKVFDYFNAPPTVPIDVRARIWTFGVLGLANVLIGLGFGVMVSFALPSISIVVSVLFTPDGWTQAGWSLGLLGVVIVGGGSLALGRRLLDYGRRLTIITLEQATGQDRRAPVLFLRSFRTDNRQLVRRNHGVFAWLDSLVAADETVEHIVAHEGWSIGPVVALGNPNPSAPAAFGPVHPSVSPDDWQSAIMGLMQRSRAILVLVDQTDGVAWECDAIHRMGYQTKTLFARRPSHSAEWNAEVWSVAGPQVGAVLMMLSEHGVALRDLLGLDFRRDGESMVYVSKSGSRRAYDLMFRSFLRNTAA